MTPGRRRPWRSRAGGCAERLCGGAGERRPGTGRSARFRVTAVESSPCGLEVGLFPLSSSPAAASMGPYRQVKRREGTAREQGRLSGGHNAPASKLSTNAKVIQGTCSLFSLPRRLRYHHLSQRKTEFWLIGN